VSLNIKIKTSPTVIKLEIKSEMREKVLGLNNARPSAKINSLLQKLRETQERVLEEKACKWGFDFKHSVPAEPTREATSIGTESVQKITIDW